MKATIFKASIQLADMDRQVYNDFNVTLARHPSETDERLLVRLLAFVLHAPTTTDNGSLEFAKDLWNADEPCLWQRDLTGSMVHWMEVGQPDDRRLLRVTARSKKVTVFAYGSSAPIWWSNIFNKLTRAQNLQIWHILGEQSEALSLLAQRTMSLQVNVQDGVIWISDDQRTVEVTPNRLHPS